MSSPKAAVFFILLVNSIRSDSHDDLEKTNSKFLIRACTYFSIIFDEIRMPLIIWYSWTNQDLKESFSAMDQQFFLLGHYRLETCLAIMERQIATLLALISIVLVNSWYYIAYNEWMSGILPYESFRERLNIFNKFLSSMHDFLWF